jgi:hypothetical protein
VLRSPGGATAMASAIRMATKRRAILSAGARCRMVVRAPFPHTVLHRTTKLGVASPFERQ